MADYTDFTNPQNYLGSRIGQDVALGKKSLYPPKVVPLDIDWSLYPDNCVQIDLRAGAGQLVMNPLDMIKSVYIDNIDNKSPVTAQFPDTMFRTVAKPNAVITAQVSTNQTLVYIFRDPGITIPGFTRVYIANFLLDPYTQEELNSSIAVGFGSSVKPNGSVNYTPFGTGQKTSWRIDSLTTNFNNNLTTGSLDGPYSSGLIIFHSIEAYIFGVYSDTANAREMRVELRDSGGNSLMAWFFMAMPGLGENYQYKILEQTTTLNFPWPATDSLFLVNSLNVASSGYFGLKLYYDWVNTI